MTTDIHTPKPFYFVTCTVVERKFSDGLKIRFSQIYVLTSFEHKLKGLSPIQPKGALLIQVNWCLSILDL